MSGTDSTRIIYRRALKNSSKNGALCCPDCKRKSSRCRWTWSGACRRRRQEAAIVDMSSSGTTWRCWASGRITSTTSFSSNFSKQHDWHLHAFESALRAAGEIDFLRHNGRTGKRFQGVSGTPNLSLSKPSSRWKPHKLYDLGPYLPMTIV